MRLPCHQVEFSNIESLEVFGSDRDDRLVALTTPESGSTPFSPYSFIDGYEGTDTLVADYSNFGSGVSIFNDGISLVADGFDGRSNRIEFSQIEGFDITTGRGHDILELSSGLENFDYTIDAGAGDDTLIGGSSSEILAGGIGADNFVFNTLSSEIDIITDFQPSQNDKIEVSAAGFGASSLDQFIYDSLSGALFFDSDPSDPMGRQQFALLENKPPDFSPSVDIILI